MTQAGAPQATQPATRPLTVLVADNDADMRRYIRRSLRLLGRRVGRVVEAADGEAALSMLRQEPIDVLITDVVMPRMNGLALCEALVADASLRSIPVLIVTGEVSLEQLRRRMDDRLHWDQLTKPFNASMLGERMTHLLEIHPET